MATLTEKISGFINEKAGVFEAVSDSIWDFAEFRFCEFKSSKMQREVLAGEGFIITAPIAGMETAFMAEWGNGGPIIGILGEFDALPNLSQTEGGLKKEYRESHEYGHGCGHHLLGAGAVEACVAVKDFLKQEGLEGRIRYYATPAEEGASGKTFMLRSGCFLDLDICISWHPDSKKTCGGSTLSMVRAYYRFRGKSAHAGVSPHLGRSALDAVELMDVGCNYLREHIIPEARLHYAITDTGGTAPNTVQSEAEVCYNIRAPRDSDMLDIYERVKKIADGASMMTETSVNVRTVSYYANFLDNDTLNRLSAESMDEIVDERYTAEELEQAKEFQTVLSEDGIRLTREEALRYSEKRGKHCSESPISLYMVPVGTPKPASTDLGNVSWNVPTAMISTVCYAAGTALHSWQAVAQGKTPLAHRGMRNAAAVMALTAAKLFIDPTLIGEAKNDFHRAKDGKEYRCILPDDLKPGDF